MDRRYFLLGAAAARKYDRMVQQGSQSRSSTALQEGVRAHKREMLNCEIEEGAASTVLVHLANISYRLGRTIHFDPKTLTCVNDAEANKLATRVCRKPYVVPEKV
jgi:hypothetical protein